MGSPIQGHAGAGAYDAFVVSLLTDGTVNWNTFMGSTTGADYGSGITVDPTNSDIYITGSSSHLWGTPIVNHASSGLAYDGFAAKLNNSGLRIWNTFMGSTDWDNANAIKLK